MLDAIDAIEYGQITYNTGTTPWLKQWSQAVNTKRENEGLIHTYEPLDGAGIGGTKA